MLHGCISNPYLCKRFIRIYNKYGKQAIRHRIQQPCFLLGACWASAWPFPGNGFFISFASKSLWNRPITVAEWWESSVQAMGTSSFCFGAPASTWGLLCRVSSSRDGTQSLGVFMCLGHAVQMLTAFLLSLHGYSRRNVKGEKFPYLWHYQASPPASIFSELLVGQNNCPDNL